VSGPRERSAQTERSEPLVTVGVGGGSPPTTRTHNTLGLLTFKQHPYPGPSPFPRFVGKSRGNPLAPSSYIRQMPSLEGIFYVKDIIEITLCRPRPDRRWFGSSQSFL